MCLQGVWKERPEEGTFTHKKKNVQINTHKRL